VVAGEQTALVIFGAAVRHDGSPSKIMQRRLEGAIAAWRAIPGALLVPTGGPCASGFVEAEVMRAALIEAGVPASSILVEPQARDTLESVRRCHRLLIERGFSGTVVPCTSRFHIPRCAVLFRILGWAVRLEPMPSDSGKLSRSTLLLYALKELLALPYDALLLCTRLGVRR